MMEEVCPWCHGVGGQWEVVVTKTRNIQVFENCRGCHGLGMVLRNLDSKASSVMRISKSF